MFRHLLVPLDGSRLAEAALPASSYLATTVKATVSLLHVIEKNAPSEVHHEHHLTEAAAAEAYLADVAKRAFPAGVSVSRHVHTAAEKDVARSIAAHAVELDADLVVLCTHGRGGPRDWLFGSIAQQVVANGTVPTLLIRPDPAVAGFAPTTLLVPLDGSPAHEPALALAAGWAQATGAALRLLLVVPTFATLTGERAVASRLLPGAAAAALELEADGAVAYLRRHCDGLAPDLTVTGQVARGDPVTVIADTAATVGAGLIVLGTHAKAGANAFWAGSVAPRVAAHTRLPLLLVPLASV